MQIWDLKRKKYLTAKSTRTSNEREARKIARSMVEDYNSNYIDFSSIKVVDYGLGQWCEDSSLVELRKMSGPNGITKEYVRNNASNWTNHLGPILGGIKLKDVTPETFTRVYTTLSKSQKRLSNSTIANVINTLRVTLNHAHAMGHLDRDIVPRGLRISRTGRARDSFTDAEVQGLLHYSWADRNVELMVKTAAAGGLRQGELLALRLENLREDSVLVEASLSKVEGLKCPKSKRHREVVLPRDLIVQLREHGGKNPYSTGQVFWNPKNGGFLKPKYLNESLQLGMRAVGISGVESSARLLGFHALRH